MISYIKGILIEKEREHIVVEGGAIGYRIHMPMNAIERLPHQGNQVVIHTYFHVKEDAMQLYGFLTPDDRELFKLLIGVSGIGPKGALGILTTLSSDDLRFAVLSGDAKGISKSPGVGLKTAQKLILELKDKLSLEDAFEKKMQNDHGGITSETAGAKEDAVLALTSLGYSQTEALRAVSGIAITPEMKSDEILKLALKKVF